MSPDEIISKIKIAQIALTKGNSEIKTLGIKKAEAKRNYAIALNKRILHLKADKYPATLIQDMARGGAAGFFTAALLQASKRNSKEDKI